MLYKQVSETAIKKESQISINIFHLEQKLVEKKGIASNTAMQYVNLVEK